MPVSSDNSIVSRSSVSSLTDDQASGHHAFLRALLAGREDAWDEFYQRYAHRLRAYLQTLWQGPPHHLDDLLQDTLLRAVKYLKPLPSEEALWSWLTVLARSAIADHGRVQSRFHRFLQRLHLEPQPLPPLSDHALSQALAQLDEPSRELLRLKYEECCRTRELAQRFSLSEKAIESRLARLRKKLRRLLSSQSPS